MKYLASALAGAGAFTFALWWLHVPEAKVDAQKVYSEGYAQGRKDALNVRNVGEDLEYACINLWFGKDGPAYWAMRRNYEQAERAQSK
jgi:hypothetical protein